jgi:Leucine-rich repeat (LRR) protein
MFCIGSQRPITENLSIEKGLEKEIVAVLNQNKGVQKLTIQNCLLSERVWTAICNMQHLRELHLSDCEIKSVPKQIGKLQKLQILNLTRADIKELPAEIGKLKKLHLLDLQGSSIENLPNELQNFHHSCTLNLLGCDKLFFSNVQKFCNHSFLTLVYAK